MKLLPYYAHLNAKIMINYSSEKIGDQATDGNVVNVDLLLLGRYGNVSIKNRVDKTQILKSRHLARSIIRKSSSHEPRHHLRCSIESISHKQAATRVVYFGRRSSSHIMWGSMVELVKFSILSLSSAFMQLFCTCTKYQTLIIFNVGHFTRHEIANG